MSEPDILAIDARIKKSFENERLNLAKYKSKLLGLKNSVLIQSISKQTKKDIEESIKSLEKKVYNIENNEDLSFYISETVEYIRRYEKILLTPIKISFCGKKKKNNKEKREVIKKYLSAAHPYIDNLLDGDIGINTVTQGNMPTDIKIICNNCNNKKKFDILDTYIYICTECGSQQEKMTHTSSYKDIDRINISVKYTYDRKVHFRDCINQYQGKQNSTIDKKVYKDLEEQFRLHHLLKMDETGYKRFSNIKKEHIMLFLKELGYIKHYENIHLIHYVLTGIKPDDISHLESKLLDDFDSLTDLYDKKYKFQIERKNFINTQYVLFQLLRRHKHPCSREDFTILKTGDRQWFHDKITKELFTQLGWNHNPIF